MKFIKGNVYYYHIQGDGLVALIYESESKQYFEFRSFDDYKKEIDKCYVDYIFENADFALIQFFEKKTGGIQSKIESHQKTIDELNNELAEMNKSTQELKDKYPEEFI